MFLWSIQGKSIWSVSVDSDESVIVSSWYTQYSDSISNVFTARCYTESGIAIAVRLVCLSVHWSSV